MTTIETGQQPATAIPPAQPAATGKRRRRKREAVPAHLRANLIAYLMIAPMVILLGIFVIWPMIYAVYLSFYRISFYKPPKFVGLDFYGFVLTDPEFWESLLVGLKYTAIVLPVGLVLAFLLASLIASVSRRAASFLKVTVYIPASVSSVVAAVVFLFIYQDDGVGNWFIGLVGAGPIAWINDPAFVLPAVAAPGLWLGFGITTLIMLAGLLDIPDTYYESASLDGAGFVKRTWYITIPMLKNVLLFLIVTGFTVAFQEFLLPLIMTNGGPVSATTTPNLFIFNSFRDGTPYATSFSLAAAILLFVVLGLVSIVIFRLVNSEKATEG